MAEFTSITDLATKIKDDLLAHTDRKSIALIYAFNATGKTRLSVEFDAINYEEKNEDGHIKVLSYNAFLEDLFVWDNEGFVLKFSPDDWRIRFIQDQGLENKIVENFRLLTNSKIEPVFTVETYNSEVGEAVVGKSAIGGTKVGEISFSTASGDGETVNNIKVSRSEESLLVWSVFYSILETVIEELNTEEEDRSTDIFNHLEYIVIDDPVSSIDDERIISLAVKLHEVVKSHKNKEINFLITTHHALFFNVLFNSFRRLAQRVNKYGKKYYHFYIFSKNDNILKLEDQNDDSPFAYHLLVKTKIQEAIDTAGLEKYHFNLLRTLLEKTANFLGYAQWSDCILGEETKEEVKRLVNLYSHSKLSELESVSLSNADKELFTEAFNAFVKDFRYQ